MKFDLSRISIHHNGARAPVLEASPGERPGQWTIEFDTLEQLMAFADAHGQIIVSGAVTNKWTNKRSLPFIEIYDDYRE